ncbi:Sensor histidine kinase DesK [compost metagenome]
MQQGILKQEGDNLTAKVYTTKAVYFAGRELWDSTIQNCIAGLALLKTCKDKQLEMAISDIISTTYLRQGNYPKAFFYYRAHIDQLNQQYSPAFKFEIMMNIFSMGNASENDSLKLIGKHYLFAAKALTDSVRLDNAQPILDHSLAIYYYSIQEGDSGLYYSYRVMDWLNRHDYSDDQLKMTSYANTINYLIGQKRYSEAKRLFSKMQQNTDTSTYSRASKSQYWNFYYQLEKQSGNSQFALQAFKRLKTINDSIAIDEQNEQLQQYEIRMKQLANDNYVKEKEYEARDQKYSVVFWTIIAIMTAAGSIFIYFHSKKKRQVERRYWQQLQIQKEFEHKIELQEERNRISREMHDDLGATLTSTLLAVEMVEMFPEQKQYLDIVRSTANNLRQQVNEIIWNMDTQNISIPSLNIFMISFALKFLEQADIKLHWEESVEDEQKQVSFLQRRMIYLSFKELINNIVKHASATEVWLFIQTQQDYYKLVIIDNGVGMKSGYGTQGLSADKYRSSGNGLANISRNLSRLFGTVEWKLAAGGGTRVELNFKI